LGTVRLQLDAAEVMVLKFWSELQDRLGSVELQLVYFQENDPQQALTDIMRARGPAWERYVVDAFNRYPWMKARGLSGVGGMLEMIGQYFGADRSFSGPVAIPSPETRCTTGELPRKIRCDDRMVGEEGGVQAYRGKRELASAALSGYFTTFSATGCASLMPRSTVRANATIARRKRKLSTKPRNARCRCA
jgi:hypothetical protein